MKHKKINCCRLCKSKSLKKIINLGKQPLANNLVFSKNSKEYKVPLELVFCNTCKLSQLSYDVNPKEMFEKYYWVTGTSKVAQNHAKKFKSYIDKLSKIKIKSVLEIASNDGTFLKRFKNKKNLCIGVDPAKNIVKKANKEGIKTYPNFFNNRFGFFLKKKYNFFDLVFARNVFPHVPNPKEILKGMSKCMHDDSLGVIEFHYSGEILKDTQYDSIYHEHYFYYSLSNLNKLLKEFNFNLYHVEKSPISGGSLIIFFSKKKYQMSSQLHKFLIKEKTLKLNNLNTWKKFSKKVYLHRDKIKKILKNKKEVLAYGASARSSTFLNFCKISNKLIKGICDKNILKHNKYTPGSKIQIINPSKINWKKEIYVVILSWNFYNEILGYLKKKGFKGVILKTFPKVLEKKL